MIKGRDVGTEDYRGKPRVRTVNTDPSMTVQSDSHLADITNIMANYAETGLDQLDETEMIFRDVSEFTDLQDALQQAREAEVQFLKLPSKVREVYDHDVAIWLDTAHDDDKRDALVQLGYLKKKTPDVAPAEEPPGDPEGAPLAAGAEPPTE